jgi:hypothetical protein
VRMTGLVPLTVLWALTATVGALDAHPQCLYAVTETLAATRQAVAVYVECLDMDKGVALPGLVLLPGPSAVAPPVVSPAGGSLLVTSGTPWSPLGETGPDTVTAVSLAHNAPFRVLDASRTLSVPGWWQRAAAVVSGDGGDFLVLEGRRVDEYGAVRGRLDFRALGPGPEPSVASAGMTLPLPGEPLAVVSHAGSTRLSVLCAGPDNGLLLCQTGPDGGAAHIAPLTGLGLRDGARPSLAVSSGGGLLFVLASGSSPDAPGSPQGGQPSAQVLALDARTAAPLGSPVILPGDPESRVEALFPAQDNACWALTRAPGTDFAWLSLLRPVGSGLELADQVALAGVAHPVRAALSPGGDLLAVSVNDRVELWHNAAPYASHTLEHTVRCLLWTSGGLFAGEAGRVHRLDTETARPLSTVQLQTGHVAWLAQAGEDDSTAFAFASTPVLAVPPLYFLRARAAGRERRVIPLGTGEGPGWLAGITGPAADRVVVTPPAGAFPGLASISLADPASPGSVHETEATVWIQSMDESGAIRPGRTDLRILPDADPVRRVLWVLAGPSRELPVLDAFLSGPPHYFATRTADGLHPGPLTANSVVVLDAAAAAQGALTRPALLEFVSGGGGLLFLGGALPGESTRALTDWLSPFGVQLDTDFSMTGSFSALDHAPLTRDFANLLIRDGCGIRMLDTAGVVASVPSTLGAGQVVFAALTYGIGRVAVIAGPDPFTDDALSGGSNLRFAATLFRWLSLASVEVHDADGDGLTDSDEDRNGNGIVDPGETDPFRADTDGDGIPDGMEDLNRNGRVDAGETNPLNPDSDGDGIHDGADPMPVPAADAPQVAYVEPRSFPAQGGMQVLVAGRNLSPATEVWIGGRRAPRVQYLDDQTLLAEAPPGADPSGGPADVRVVNPADGREGLLRDGAVYTPVSAVRAELVVTVSPEEGAPGQMAVRLGHGPDTMPGRASFIVTAQPPGTVRWETVALGQAATGTGRTIAWRVADDGALWIDLSDGAREPLDGMVAVATWFATGGEAPVFRLENARVAAPNGVPLAVDTPGNPEAAVR